MPRWRAEHLNDDKSRALQRTFATDDAVLGRQQRLVHTQVPADVRRGTLVVLCFQGKLSPFHTILGVENGGMSVRHARAHADSKDGASAAVTLGLALLTLRLMTSSTRWMVSVR